MNKIIENLNDSQKEAVLYNDGPSLVIAGAGAGKTRVLTSKIAGLLQQGIPPWNIMALTFTNKAAKEMKERIATMVDPQAASRLQMGTFHSIFLRILRAEAQALDYPSDFTIYDTSDTKSLLKSIIKEVELDDKTYKPSAVYARISAAKNDLISASGYASHPDLIERDIHSKMPRVAEIYKRYVMRCRMAKAMDFDDLLFNTNVLFRDFPEILATYQQRFQFILVDEYQDTNFSQYLIIKKLAAKHHRICVVGDDSQSIYSFRGANIDNILNFQKSYPECRLFKLEQNYRSTQNIVNLANSLIAKNQRQIPKKVFSKRDIGQRAKVIAAFSDIEEAYMVANKINELHLTIHDNWNQFAVLYRTNAQSRLLEEALRKRNIPYRLYGGMSFYQRKEIKDVIAYLRLALNPNDEEAFKRVLNYPARGIGDTTMQKLLSAASIHQISLWDVLSAPASYQVNINSGTANKLSAFRDLINAFRQYSSELNVYDFCLKVVNETGIRADVNQDISIEGLARKENIDALLSGMHDFCQSRLEEENPSVFIGDYLSEVSLLTDMDEDNDPDEEKVTLMTIHASKGLEFKNVFITGLEENLFPSLRNIESERELEEERRLLYVAITRAENYCVLSYAKSRFRNGKSEYPSPSRFLRDLDSGLLDMPSANTSPLREENRTTFQKQHFNNAGFSTNRTTLFKAPTSKPSPNTPGTRWSKIPATGDVSKTAGDEKSGSYCPMGNKGIQTSKGRFHVGQRILHERFGEGLIQKIEGEGDNCKIGVKFIQAGFKLLLLKYASIKAFEE